MKKITNHFPLIPFLCGMLVFVLVMVFTTRIVSASSHSQEDDPSEDPTLGDASTVNDPLELENVEDCGECHLDISDKWMHSPHAHAYDDPYFQDQWVALGKPGDCLACHTTEYMASTGEYAAEGVYCEACHGKVYSDHPPAIVSLEADTEYCGSCHTTTLSEWRSTGHSPADVGCMDCHDPHSQQALFENPDDLCINCHQEDMERYLEDLHVQKDIGCVDCHALVIPPEVPPDDGIVPTGHAFDITPATCVACHTDALHAGFSLPGFEDGATPDSTEESEGYVEGEGTDAEMVEAESLTPDQQIDALETALASRNITTLFQGGVVGIVLGGSTAWLVSRNISHGQVQEDEDEEDGEE